MLETLEKGNIKWLLKKREITSSYYMESEETSRKRKCEEANDENETIKRSEAQNLIGSSFNQKRRRFTEDSTINIKEGYYHHHNHMSLDLELNLSPSLIIDLNHQHDLSNYTKSYEENERKKQKMMEKGSGFGLQTRKNKSMVPFELDDDDGCNHEGEEEMVARVCMKCHMLVMFCKALPVCPNCKFMHSPEDTSLSLIFTPKPSTLLA